MCQKKQMMIKVKYSKKYESKIESNRDSKNNTRSNSANCNANIRIEEINYTMSKYVSTDNCLNPKKECLVEVNANKAC